MLWFTEKKHVYSPGGWLREPHVRPNLYQTRLEDTGMLLSIFCIGISNRLAVIRWNWKTIADQWNEMKEEEKLWGNQEEKTFQSQVEATEKHEWEEKILMMLPAIDSHSDTLTKAVPITGQRPQYTQWPWQFHQPDRWPQRTHWPVH